MLIKDKHLVSVALGIVLVVLITIPMRIVTTFNRQPVPQAIFVLGGAMERMSLAAKFWQNHQNLDIWVSDYEDNLKIYRRMFQQFAVPEYKLHFDGRATDTVTNFTSMVDQFTSRDLRHIYLITSDYHMLRSRVIATIVFGSHGIVITPVIAPSPVSVDEPESPLRILRDSGRSLLWIVTGRTGASLNPRLKHLD